jgi:VWFA-related protein
VGKFVNQAFRSAILPLIACLLPPLVAGQVTNPVLIVSPNGPTSPFDNSLLNMTMLNRKSSGELSPLQNPALNVSQLDLKAPKKAKQEYDKGMQLLARTDFRGASEHFVTAISLYAEFVAAHNALGSAYLSQKQNEAARDEFMRAVALDDHLPLSHLNLGSAQLALGHFAEARAAVQKAASLAPLDLQAQTALAYAELMSRDLPGAIATAQQVHSHPHKGAALVHYYAAAAWESQNNIGEEQRELQTLLREDSSSPAAQQARAILAEMKGPLPPTTDSTRAAVSAGEPVFTQASSNDAAVAGDGTPLQGQKALQDIRQRRQIAEAEAMCPGCEGAKPEESDRASPRDNTPAVPDGAGLTLRSTVDEVAVFFAATDHGKSVTDLTRDEIGIRDDGKPPALVTGFLSESQLPLRLGLVIDISGSVTSRLAFEQKAGASFLQQVVTDKDDLAFVVGFANSVLLVQDFTADQAQIARGISRLTAAGGTALWDAVAYGADKLASLPETRPVARILVVVSDGEDNASNASLKQAIETALRGEVTIYTVSTRDYRDTTTTFNKSAMELGDRALRILAEATGGSAFFPGSLGYLNHDLAGLQQVIRGRYLVAYKPAGFKADGQYHTISISASKEGRKLRVYARHGYYAKLAGGGQPAQ